LENQQKVSVMSSTNDPKTRSLEYLVNNGEDTVTVTVPLSPPSTPPPRAQSAPPAAPKKLLKKEFEKNGLVKGCPMDSANAEAAAVLVTEGAEAAVKHMFTKPDGTSRSYGDMRTLYG
jgi:hypothetical protein